MHSAFKCRNQVNDLIIEFVDVAKGHIDLRLKNPRRTLALLPKSAPLSKLQIGDVVHGVVRVSDKSGVYVDIGAEVNGRLKIPQRFRHMVKVNTTIADLKISFINTEKKKLNLTVSDPFFILWEIVKNLLDDGLKEGYCADTSVPVSTPPARGKELDIRTALPRKPHSRTLAKSPILAFRPGDLKDGIVTQIAAEGAFVKIDGSADGLLVLPKHVKDVFRIGDNVHGMQVEQVDPHQDVVVLSLADPELEIVPKGRFGSLSTQRLVQLPKARSPPRNKDKHISSHSMFRSSPGPTASAPRAQQFPTIRATKSSSPQPRTTVHRSLSRDTAKVTSSQSTPSAASTSRLSRGRSCQFPVWGVQRQFPPKIVD